MNSADEVFILFAAILKKMQKRTASCPTTISMNYARNIQTSTCCGMVHSHIFGYERDTQSTLDVEARQTSDEVSDWVEHQHQITRRLRIQFRTTKDMDMRADAMARLHQQQTDPKVIAYIKEVEEEAARGPRKDYTKADKARKEERKRVRLVALAN
eukprot:scaffold6708_cov153-Skeletonema_marinoi.AAC.7